MKETKKKSEKNTETIESNEVKKPSAKKINHDFYVEFQGHQISEESIMDKFVTKWKEDRKLSEIKTLSVYLKIEESTAYFLVNEKETVTISI